MNNLELSGYKLLRLLLLIVLTFSFFNCGGDTPTNNNNNNGGKETSDFFPLGVGSWWKYKVSFDPKNDDFSIDSTVLESKKLVNGKDSYMFVSFIKNKNSSEIVATDTCYYYKEGPKIYKFLYNHNKNQKEWQLFADIQLEYIKIFEYPFTTEMDDQAFFHGVMKMERVIEGPEKFFLGNTIINCIKSKVIVSIEGELTKKDSSKEPYFEITITEYQWFGYNVGLVKLFWPNDEYNKTLLDYYLVKEE